MDRFNGKKLVLPILFGVVIAYSSFSSFEAYSDNVVLAEAPSNVGGNGNGFASGAIDISNGGGHQSVQSFTPNIIYAPNSDDGTSSILTIESGNGTVNSSDEDNAVSIMGSQTNIIGFDKTKSDTEKEQEPAMNHIYVPDSDDDCPVNSAVPLAVELQEYLWTKAKKATSDYKNYYAFLLGVMERESTFRPSATHHNKDGSIDRGIMQINSSNIGKMKRAGLIGSNEDLYDAYKCIDCGVHMLNYYISMFGISESAYYAYNTGIEKQGSNRNSKIVMKNMSKWNTILFG